MTNISLQTSSGYPKIDQILLELICAIEHYFSDRICGYYLVGSYACGEAIITSDLDLVIVFKDWHSPAEKQKFALVRQECQLKSPISLDFKLYSQEELFRVGGVRFQTDSLLLYGQDIRSAVKRKPFKYHLRDTMYAQYHLFARVRGNPEVLTFPLSYPDSEGEFYGYDGQLMRLPDGSNYPGIKDLALNVLSPAQALVWLQADKYVGNGKKSDISVQYRLWINDKWTKLIEKIYANCRQAWSYLVPEDSSQRQQLRELCQEGLGFENNFLEHYKEYLLKELPQEEPSIQLIYIRRLGQLIYQDQAVVDVLQQIAQGSNTKIQKAINKTLSKY